MFINGLSLGDGRDEPEFRMLTEMLDQLSGFSSRPHTHAKRVFWVGSWIGGVRMALKVLGFNQIRKSLATAHFGWSENVFQLPKDTILKQSLNGFVLLAPARGVALKTMSKALGEEFFLTNAETASRLYPHLAPKIIETCSAEQFDLLIEEFSIPLKTIGWNEYSRRWLPRITRDLLKVDGVNAGDSKDLPLSHDPSVLELLSEPLSGLGCLDESLTEVKTLVIQLLEHEHSAVGQPEVQSQPRRFAHGDLTPSNLVVTGDNYVLVDWTNGGWSNFAYDLLMTIFYFPNAKDWLLVSKENLEENDKPLLFRGQLQFYEEWYKRNTGEPLALPTLKNAIVISCVELAIRNFRRHRTKKWACEGSQVLDLVARALRHFA